MSTSDKVRALLALNGKKIIELAVHFDMTRQSMSNKMLRDSWSAEDLKKVAAFVDCDYFFEMKDGQRIYLFSQADQSRFGPPIPKMEEVRQIGPDKFLDARGNAFNRSDITLNQAMGGGLERVSADGFDDPMGTKEDARRFRKLDQRMEAIMRDRLERGEITEITDAVEADRPDDISAEEWKEYLEWIRQ